MKVMIVEDNKASQILMKLHFKGIAECECAENGKDAFDMFTFAIANNSPYDLICLDINMPEMDGHELLQKIRKYELDNQDMISSKVKIIMTSALGDPQNVVTSYKEGCEDYIVKPVKKSELMQKIESLGLCVDQVK